MTTTSDDETRLLLLAAVAITRPAGLDGYLLGRLAHFGYTRAQVEVAALRLVRRAEDETARKVAQCPVEVPR